MSKRKIIFWIFATTCLVLTALLEMTEAEESSWKYADFRNVLSTLLFVIVCGLALGIFLFRKKKFQERILITIPIAMIAFSLFMLAVVLNHNYGLTDKYNYFTAKRDLRNGKVQLVVKGLIMPESEEEQQIRKRFGYDIVWDGCTITNDGYEKYNDVMEKYLEKINGKGWQIKQQHLLDSVRHLKNFN